MTQPGAARQIALVTGANGSLGKAVVSRFLAAGVTVIATYHLKKPDSEQTGNPQLNWVQMDVTSSQSVKVAIQKLPPHLAKVDHLIHCAGGFRYATLEAIKDDDLEFLVDVNLRSSVYLARELTPKMKKNGFGRIVFVSAKATLAPSGGMGPYSATKAGLNALVSALADELRPFDINVNAVLPSVIDTPANRKEMPKANFSTWVPAESLAEIIFSLTQEWGKPIHGALIPVAGRL